MYQQKIRFGGQLTPVVKKLIIINTAIFVFQSFIEILLRGNYIALFFGLSYAGVFEHLYIWQIFTYMFLHGGLLHIFFNLFALWMFGGDLENRWGSNFFLKYYLWSGVGAGIFISILNYVMHTNIPTIGASGAIYGLLLAYGITWPDREVLIYFLFPIKMKYLVIIFGLLEFFGTLKSYAGVGENISHIGHLGGLISGFIILTMKANYLKNKKRTSGTVYKANFQKKQNVFEKYKNKKRIQEKQEKEERQKKAKDIIDRLLNKISINGMESLTIEERKDLEWARKNYYPDKNDILH